MAALPAVALAHPGEHPPGPDTKPDRLTAPAGDGDPAALGARGRGKFAYRGSGGISIRGRGLVRVRAAEGSTIEQSAEGFGRARSSDDGTRWRYAGRGTVVVDCSRCVVMVRGRFHAEVDPTQKHTATGVATVRGRGKTRLAGGRAASFRRAGRLVLSTGPLDVDLMGRIARHGPPKSVDDPGGHPGRREEDDRGRDEGEGPEGGRRDRPADTDDRTPGPRGGPQGQGPRRKPGRRFGHRRAQWSLGGPARGAVSFDELTGRLKVWDLSEGADLVVTVPDGTETETRDDGLTIYRGLRDAAGVTVAGTAFRMVAKGPEVDGAFTPAADSLARSTIRGRGTFTTPDGEYRAHGRRATRVLLQPQPPADPAPEAGGPGPS